MPGPARLKIATKPRKILSGKYNLFYCAPVNLTGDEAYRNVTFTLLSEDNRVCTIFLSCKDYINNVLYGTVRDRGCGIKYKDNAPRASLDPIKLAVTAIPSIKTLYEALRLINEFEDRVPEMEGYTRLVPAYIETKLEIGERDKAKVWYFEAPSQWGIASPVLNTMAYLIRLVFRYSWHDGLDSLMEFLDDENRHKGFNKKSYRSGVDWRYWKKGAGAGIKFILEHGLQCFLPEQSDNFIYNGAAAHSTGITKFGRRIVKNTDKVIAIYNYHDSRHKWAKRVKDILS